MGHPLQGQAACRPNGNLAQLDGICFVSIDLPLMLTSPPPCTRTALHERLAAPSHASTSTKHRPIVFYLATSTEEGFDLFPVDGVSSFPGLRMVVRVDRYMDILLLIHGPFISRVFTVHVVEQVFCLRLVHVQQALHVLQGDGLVGILHEFQDVLPGTVHECRLQFTLFQYRIGSYEFPVGIEIGGIDGFGQFHHVLQLCFSLHPFGQQGQVDVSRSTHGCFGKHVCHCFQVSLFRLALVPLQQLQLFFHV